jgi:predicted transcriptional regulator
VVVDIRSTPNAFYTTSAIAQFVKQQRWQMLKLLEGLGKTANINAVWLGDSL